MNAEKLRLTPQLHRYISLFFLAVLSVGLYFSVFLVSVAGIALAANWLWEGHYKNKITRLLHNKPALLVLGFFLLHVIGLLWTHHDINYGLKDIRIKLPLLLFPIVLGSVEAFTKREEKLLGSVFILSGICATLYSYYLYNVYYPHEITDIRNISTFNSHIRFSLLLVTGNILLFYGIYTQKIKGKAVYFAVFIMLWFTYFIGLLHVISGALGLLAVVASAVFLFAGDVSLKYRTVIYSVLIISIVGITGYLTIKGYQYVKPKQDFNYDITHTARGEAYTHNLENKERENGYFINHFIAHNELENAWNERSNIDYHNLDKRGQPLHSTLIRFITSKGEKKDAAAVENLSVEEVQAIENGIASKAYLNAKGLELRMLKVLFELNNYKSGADPRGHSVAMRFEFLKTGFYIFKKHPYAGTGTGDIKHAFEQAYIETQNPLPAQYRYRAHNQFLTAAVTFGLPGLLLFLLCFVVPVKRALQRQNRFFVLFAALAAVSMLSEDTLETQIGVTFFALFFFVFLNNLQSTPQTHSKIPSQ